MTEERAAALVERVAGNHVRSSLAAFAEGTLSNSTLLPFFTVRTSTDDVYHVSPFGGVFVVDETGTDGQTMLSGAPRRLRRVDQ